LLIFQRGQSAAAKSAVEKVDKEIQSVAASASRNLAAVKAKVSSDLTALKADVGRAKHKLDVKVAETRAEDLEWDASFAIDYACHRLNRASEVCGA
jgi:hypothetical protein